MIHVYSWTSKLVNELELESINCIYEYTFTHSDHFDERSDWTNKYIRKISKQVVPVDYCSESVQLTIGGQQLGVRNLENYKIPRGKLLVDATSLALPELLQLFHIFHSNKRPFDVIYVQPTGYTENKTEGLDKIKSYDLSDDGLGIQQVPPHVGFVDNSMLFFFLGFEGHRFGAVINSDEVNTSNVTCLIGAPPFKLSWENKTLSNNYKQLLEINNSANTRFKFAGANDPIKTYEIIDQIYRAVNYERKTLCLAPFGTKPAAIAAAQFAVNNSNVVMFYDYVKKKPKRSSGTDFVHIWSFQYSD